MRRGLTAVAVAAGAFAVAVLLGAGGGGVEAQQTESLLRVESRLTYDVRPDAGPVHVTWQVSLQNNDPSTVFSNFGVSYFYSSITLPIFRGAESVGATGPDGGSLFVSVDESGADPLVPATISLGEALFFGGTYSFTLSYNMESARNDAVLVTPSYVFLPALAHGDSASVTINTPDAASWDVTVEDVDVAECSKSGGSYQCSAPGEVIVPAVVEVSQPDALESLTSDIDVPSGAFDLTVEFFPGEQSWARRVEEITTVALPVLEELFGVPYDGPRALTIAERGRQDIAGFEGLFDCALASCEIGISPIADDHALLHELAHLWTRPFETRWIGEGLAEFMSRRAAFLLGPTVDVEEPFDFEIIDFPLDTWPQARFILGASEEERRRENSGYRESLRLFETLDQRIGLEAIQDAQGLAADAGDGVDTEAYFDMLEEASSANLDGLFLDEVFPDSRASDLEQRRLVRGQLGELRTRAEAAGLAVPELIENDVSRWRFDSAERRIEEADAALDAYEDASADVGASRSVWERIGLVREDPDGTLEDARASFGEGDFAATERYAEDASEIIDGSARAGLFRALFGVQAIAAIAVTGAGIIFIIRQRGRAPGSP